MLCVCKYALANVLTDVSECGEVMMQTHRDFFKNQEKYKLADSTMCTDHTCDSQYQKSRPSFPSPEKPMWKSLPHITSNSGFSVWSPRHST